MPSSFFIKIPPVVRKSMRKIPLPWRERIWRALESIAADPFQGEKMLGRYKYLRKVRVWPYRILYNVKMEQRIVELVEVEHRGHMSYK